MADRVRQKGRSGRNRVERLEEQEANEAAAVAAAPAVPPLSAPTGGRGRARARSPSPEEGESMEGMQQVEEPEEMDEPEPVPIEPPPPVPAAAPMTLSTQQLRQQIRQVAAEETVPRGISPTEVIRGLSIQGAKISPEKQEGNDRRQPRMRGNGNNGGSGSGSSGGSAGRPSPPNETRGSRGPRGTRFVGVPDTPRNLEPAQFDMVSSRDKNKVKTGTSGVPIRLLANFFHVRRRGTWCLYHYRVEFTQGQGEDKEVIDHIGTRKALLREHASNLPAFIFDGASMHTSQLVPDNMLHLQSTRRSDQSIVDIGLQLVGQVDEADVMYLQFYTIMARKCLQHLKLALLGKNYFDPNLSVELANHRLQIWPGFLTTMRVHDAGLLYCVQSLHKVIRTDDVWTMMQNRRREIMDRGGSMDEVKDVVKKELLGTIVITHYNKRTYRVDDIDWNDRPSMTFPLKNGTETTYVDYYQSKHNITIRTVNQPLLVSNPKARDIHRGQTQPVKLIPELCFMTGLSEGMRQNFNLMREMGQYLFQAPDRKVATINNFMRRIKASPEIRQELSQWGLDIEDQMIQVAGRKFPTEQVFFKDQRSEDLKPFEVDPHKGDFTNAFRGARMVTVTPLQTWVIIVPQRDAGGVDNLLRTMQTVARPLGFNISPPTEMIHLASNSSNAYMKAINDSLAKYQDRLQMIFTILPNNKLDLYAAIKKRCYVDVGMSSQCLLARTMSNKGLMSVATKLTVQMSCKLGGEAWRTKIPLQDLMIVGFDVHHGGAGSQGSSFGAMVTTLSSTYGTYFSTVMEANDRQEIISNMAGELAKCVAAWRKQNNGKLPDRIMFYRDGVGEGQLQSVYKNELDGVKDMLKGVYITAGIPLPKLTYIVVTKRINPRFFLMGQTPQNPPPGTIVDQSVTFPERFDFYLIAQSVRQGTVSPTSYNVLFDRSQLPPDRVQLITYKLCNIYYNFSGTVSVPAPCQYAHKLALMTGTAMKRGCHEKLSRQLYFL